MVEVTRYGRVNESVEALRNTGGTQVQSFKPRGTLRERAEVRDLFMLRQRMMASAVREEPRPGLFVFCAHPTWGHVARLWLAADAQPRAGVIGRHDLVDLPLPLDDTLSLRHLLFVVRRRAEGVAFTAIDLHTPNGLRLEDGDGARLVRGAGTLFLRAGEFVFFCLPTGQPLGWDPDAPEPWATLVPRLPEGAQRRARRRGPVARLEFGARHFALTADDLRAGVLLGRTERCDVHVDDDSVSRVHAVVLELDGAVHLFDTGSTNGTWRGDVELRATPLSDGDVLRLGMRETFVTWRAVQ